jgi:hypothetical protein
MGTCYHNNLPMLGKLSSPSANNRQKMHKIRKIESGYWDRSLNPLPDLPDRFVNPLSSQASVATNVAGGNFPAENAQKIEKWLLGPIP